MTIVGLHHITLISSDAQRTTDFYTNILGMRLVKKTVNFDNPGSYHLYFGDETGSPGTAITYFEMPNAPKGKRGVGGTHHFALRVADYDGLLKWKRRLTDHDIKVDGPLDRHYFKSIYFQDPDGVIIEIATDGPGWTRDEAADHIGEEFRAPPAEMMAANRDEATIQALTWDSPVEIITEDMALLNGMHHTCILYRHPWATPCQDDGKLRRSRLRSLVLGQSKCRRWYDHHLLRTSPEENSLCGDGCRTDSPLRIRSRG